VRVQNRIGKAIALALLSVSVAACGNGNPLGSAPRTVDAQVLREVSDPQVRAFYAARNGERVWNGKSEKQLIEIIDGAPANGLRRDLFLKGDLPKDRDKREVALTRTALRYASALAQGYSDPKKVRGIYTIPRPKVDVAPGLAKALTGGDLAGWFGSLAPQTPEYRALSAEFVRYLKLANEAGNGAAIPSGKAIKPGKKDARIPAIASALVSIGYLQPQKAPPQAFAPEMVAAVKRLQLDYGQKPDGIIGEVTIKALNEGPGDRARQIAVNLERLRWLERSPPGTRIDVNTAAASLDYWRNGRLRDHRNVVVGQPGWETPQLGSPIFQLVAHPYWRVPDSIFEDELAQKGPAYFAEQNMEFRDGRLVQLPGPKNSLGEVKFDMRNDQHIYLHDTPFKALFDLPERHRSHGCIRVKDALGFAMLLASDDGVLPKFEEAMMKPDEEGFVKLRREVPVRLFYHTAFANNGAVKLVDDIYGWDDDVAYALGYVRRPTRARQHQVGGDVGP
jgi:murein L,D-transpeptidase YcbB/YkuD